MWGNTAEGGEIEDSTLIAPNEDILQWCKTPEKALDEKQNITLTLKRVCLSN